MTTENKLRARVTPHGLKWNEGELVFLFSDKKAGQVLTIKARKEEVIVRITPGGYLRVEIKESCLK